ncbi:MAG: copper resistance protein NlpE N-terminal domain-containing protein [Bacteroidales bacterium]|nr:copper resistance protein NlpE N-terminal domain-containing protein [Bacteroidales bacterium]
MRPLRNVLFFLVLSSTACRSTTVPTEKEFTPPDMHTNKISLDWEGRYEGVLPCADCEGIAITVELIAPDQYRITNVYKGKADVSFVETGSFNWSQNESSIMLMDGEDIHMSFLVGENQLIMLDTEGREIEGELAPYYRLTKSEGSFTLYGIHWQLVKLSDNAIELSDDRRQAFIAFDRQEQRVYGNAGCNLFHGSYHSSEQGRIELRPLASTMMACPEMETEQLFFQVLENVVSYTIIDGSLWLNTSDHEAAASFKAIGFE